MTQSTVTPAQRGYGPSLGIDALVVGALLTICIAGLGILSTGAQHLSAPAQVLASTGDLETPADPQADPDGPLDFLAETAPPAVMAMPRPAPTSTPEVSYTDLVNISDARGFITLMGAHGNTDRWRVGTHNTTGGHYGVNWRAKNVAYSAEGTQLQILRDDDPLGQTSGRLQTLQTYGYGRYEVVMQPARGSGLVSAFFTYTGPWFSDPHDEIDFEFLGKDLTKVYVNYFKDGRRGHHATVDLPFDAGAGPNLFAFEWRPDAIIWFANGKEIYRTPPGDTGIPRTPSRIVVNLWNGVERMEGWHGKPTFQSGAAASYSCVSYTPLGEVGRSCGQLYGPPVTPPVQVVANITGGATAETVIASPPSP